MHPGARCWLLVILVLAIGSNDGQAQAVDASADADRYLVARAVWLSPIGVAPDDTVAVATRPHDPWLGPDKALHFGASFLLTLSGQYVLVSKMDMRERQAWPVAAGTSLALGLFKELADSQRPVRPLFSWRDMAWNTAGVATAVVIILI